MVLFFHLPTLTRTLLILCIAASTLIGIMKRPFKLDEARIAPGGATLLLLYLRDIAACCRRLSGRSSFGAVMVGTAGATIGTNLINNVPMAVVLTSALQSVQHTSMTTRLGFVAATIFGCDLGPNLTTVGSLATVLWLLILRRRNVDISGLDYFKVGIIVTPLMLVTGALTIWLLLR